MEWWVLSVYNSVDQLPWKTLGQERGASECTFLCFHDIMPMMVLKWFYDQDKGYTLFCNPYFAIFLDTVEPWFNKKKNLHIPSASLCPSNSKTYEKEPRYNERIWQVPSDFVKSRFHCIETAMLNKTTFPSHIFPFTNLCPPDFLIPTRVVNPAAHSH